MKALETVLVAALAGACLSFGGAAHALGRLADVQVLDRASGEFLPIHAAGGKYWIAGSPGARYAVVVRNQTHARLLNVLAVDGVNAVSGETAAWDQTGYVLSAWQRYDVRGWRKSDAQVAAFEFTSLGDSYAARTGRAANVGVIGVAVFRERAAQEPVYEAPEPTPPSAPAPNARAADSSRAASAESAGAANGGAAQAPKSIFGDAPTDRARREAAKLGTGHGAREESAVGHTEFERAQTQPDEIITIHYDSRENLIAMGVLPPSRRLPSPLPFPGSTLGYVPDPPSRR